MTNDKFTVLLAFILITVPFWGGLLIYLLGDEMTERVSEEEYAKIRERLGVGNPCVEEFDANEDEDGAFCYNCEKEKLFRYINQLRSDIHELKVSLEVAEQREKAAFEAGREAEVTGYGQYMGDTTVQATPKYKDFDDYRKQR